MIELRVLGGLDIRTAHGTAAVDGPTQPRRQAVLLYLALAVPAGFHSRDCLMALLWPDSDEASARHSLRNALHALRRSLGEDLFLTRGEGQVSLNPEVAWCDAVELRDLLAEGRWEAALNHWTGDLAPGFHVAGAPGFERWLEKMRAALRRSMAAGAWRRVDELEASGDAPAAARAARQAADIIELDEAGVRRLIRLLDACGERAEALGVFARFARRLASEYEIEPSPETLHLVQSIRQRGAARTGTRVPHVLPIT
jgi:DNA-binding SARP family transcriptional activator